MYEQAITFKVRQGTDQDPFVVAFYLANFSLQYFYLHLMSRPEWLAPPAYFSHFRGVCC